MLQVDLKSTQSLSAAKALRELWIICTLYNISQEPLYTEIYSKKARAQSEHPDQAPAFTITVRTTQCGHTACGNFNGKTDKNLLDLPGLLWANPPFSAQRLQGFTDEPPQCQECKKLPIF